MSLFVVMTMLSVISQPRTFYNLFSPLYWLCATHLRNFAAKQPLTMEQKFGKNSIDIEALREFCEREGKEVTYRKGDQLEREGDPARWFGFVTEGVLQVPKIVRKLFRNNLTTPAPVMMTGSRSFLFNHSPRPLP